MLFSSASPLKWYALLACSAAVALLAGCGGEPGERLIPVTGKVTFRDKPVPRGTVSLRPDKAKGNTTQHNPTGSIELDGTFKLYTTGREGAPPGWYKVVVFATEDDRPSAKASPGLPVTIIPPEYNQAETSLLAIEVKDDFQPQWHEFVLLGRVPGGAGTK